MVIVVQVVVYSSRVVVLATGEYRLLVAEAETSLQHTQHMSIQMLPQRPCLHTERLAYKYNFIKVQISPITYDEGNINTEVFTCSTTAYYILSASYF